MSPSLERVPVANPYRWPAFAAIVLIGVVAWRMTRSPRRDLHDPSAATRNVAPRTDLGDSEKQIIEIFERAAPSVVGVKTAVDGQAVGTGTGFVWDEHGYIVTNWHVIRRGNGWFVTFPNDTKTYVADTVGSVPSRDLAVLKLRSPPAGLRKLALGTSHDLRVGQRVFAIGCPYGFDHSLSHGIISALGRRIQSEIGQTIEGVIQTDAAINPGNSGGPLLDSAGRLIGVTTAIHSPSGGSAGVGFAIPVDLVRQSIPQLIRGGVRAGLGINFGNVYLGRMLRLPGVVFTSIVPKSAAAKAGLKPTVQSPDDERYYQVGDIITGINGVRIHHPAELIQALAGLPAGTEVALRVLRGRKERDVKLRLQPLPTEN